MSDDFFTEKQGQFIRMLKNGDLKRLNILYGSVRSGKTWITLIAFAVWVATAPKDKAFLMCAKTLTSLKRNCLVVLQDIIGEENFSFSLSAKTGRLFGHLVYLEGANDARSESKIRGMTLMGAYVDEITLIEKDFFAMLLSRLSEKGAKLFGSTNPDSPYHWLKKDYIDRQDELDIFVEKFTIEDNTFLDHEYVEQIKKEYSGVYYSRFILGDFVAAEGLVYPDFANNTDKYVIADIDKWKSENKTHFSTVMIGVDYGGTGSATKYQATGITPKGVVVALDEEYITGEVDPDGLNKSYSAFVRRVTDKYGFAQTRADSAEQILIRGFKHTAERDGLKTQVKNAIKMPINDRIMLELLLMKQGRLFVSKDCPHLIEAFQTACYDPKSFDDVRLDDGTSDIDSLDAFEYSFESYYKQLEKYGFLR